jgi:hypothetical protein
MKHIKLFKEGREFRRKFFVGDYVRLDKGDIYIIEKWDFANDLISYEYFIKRLDKNDYGWVEEKRLEKVPDYEIDSIKYNM